MSDPRACNKCGVVKPHEEFTKGAKWRVCKECINKYHRVWHNGSEAKAEEVKQERQFRDKMHADGFSHCASCLKWYSRDRFSVDNKRKSGLCLYCKGCQHKKKNEADDRKRPEPVRENRERAEELFLADQRECPHCGLVYAMSPPKSMNGAKPRWWAAWKTCTKCRREKRVAYKKTHPPGKTNRAELCRRDPVLQIYHRCKSRQSNNGGRQVVAMKVSLDYLRHLWRNQGGFCAVTGLPFDLSFTNPKDPFAPSLDRMDSSKDYEPENVVFVLWAVNAAQNAWGYDTFIKIAHAATRQKACAFVA